MPIPNSRSRPPRILAHELRWGRGGQAATVRGLVVPEFDCSLCPRRWLCAVAALARRERRWLL